MTRFSHLTLRNYLIAAHDVLATAFALFAAFYLRFEDGQAPPAAAARRSHGPGEWQAAYAGVRVLRDGGQARGAHGAVRRLAE